MIRKLCVYCGSNDGARPAYAAAAAALGGALAARGVGLVYGGGATGLMGTVADAALAGGGEVTGVIPAALLAREVGHRGLTDLRVVDSMHGRKALMADLADGFVALPGGLGTLEELFESLTWGQLGVHAKPCALLDVEGYYRPMLEFLDAAVTEGFVRPAHRSLLLVERDPLRVLDRMSEWRAPPVRRWLDRDET